MYESCKSRDRTWAPRLKLFDEYYILLTRVFSDLAIVQQLIVYQQRIFERFFVRLWAYLNGETAAKLQLWWMKVIEFFKSKLFVCFFFLIVGIVRANRFYWISVNFDSKIWQKWKIYVAMFTGLLEIVLEYIYYYIIVSCCIILQSVT